MSRISARSLHHSRRLATVIPCVDSRADRRGGVKPGDVVAIDLIELTPIGVGKSAILREFGVLRREFPERARASLC